MLFKRTAGARDRIAASKTLFRSSRQGFARLGLERLDERVVPAFADPVNYAVGTNPSVVVAADFNNDGRLDLASANYANGVDSTVSVLLGNANGTFTAALDSSTGPHVASLAVGDLNNDGLIDLVCSSSYAVTVLQGRGDGTFQSPLSVLNIPDGEILSVDVGDFTSDGKSDLGVLVLGWGGNSDPDSVGGDVGGVFSVLAGTGSGSFSAPNVHFLDSDLISAGIAADFNSDGRLDFAAAGDWGTSVLLGNGSGSFGDSNIYGGLGSSSLGPLIAADLNADGKIDLARAFTRGGVVSMLFGTGTGQFSAAPSLRVNGQPNSVAAADFNGDGLTDLVTTYSGSAMVDVMLGRASGGFTPPVTANAGTLPSEVTIGDFNGDGRPDLAIANPALNSVSVMINDGNWLSETAPEIRIGDVTRTEGNAGATTTQFTVTLSMASTETITVEYTTANGTAAASSDYQAASGTITFAPGETGKTVTVPVNGDCVAEPNETFFVNLGNSTNATIADAQGVGTIIDDEPRITIDDVTRQEGKKNKITKFTFLITLSVAYDQPVTISFHTANGTATKGNSDYVGQTGTLTFAPGETVKKITIDVNGDSKSESDEYFYLDLSGNSSNSLFARNRGVGTILNDD